jgi:heme exporter protein B
MNPSSALLGFIQQEWMLYRKTQRCDGLIIGFFLLFICPFPMALGPDPVLLRQIGPAILWLATGFVALLSIENFWAQEEGCGRLDGLLRHPAPLGILLCIKITLYWLIRFRSLVVALPLSSFILGIPLNTWPFLVFTLMVGSWGMNGLSLVGSSLALKSNGGPLLMSILVLPLYTPIFIFGVGSDASLPSTALASFFFLIAYSLFCGFFCPLWAAISLTYQRQ